ncbi:MAG: aldo/keto reductase [Treponema sp.]|nr:aldo/keto reductase [Treponema sp.]
MARITIGKTGIGVEQNGFGALPIQRIPSHDAVTLLHKAYHGGIDFYDSARGYTDSEEKLGKAFRGRWDKIVIATKTPAKKAKQFWEDLETSLDLLKTDHIDIYQVHNPSFCPKPGDSSGLYDAMVQAKKQGKIRFIGITNHRLNIAGEAIESGLYDTLQFPLSYLSDEKDLALVAACKEKGMGFIAMKALAGGLITNSAAACAWMVRFDNVIPIWGIQREQELDEFISYITNPPVLTEAMMSGIEGDRKGLQGNFCRGCGYCMPCPKGITINMCARASLLLRRAPLEMLMSVQGKEMMKKVEDCIHCGQCSAKCPYGLDPPSLLQKNYQNYREFLAGKPL